MRLASACVLTLAACGGEGDPREARAPLVQVAADGIIVEHVPAELVIVEPLENLATVEKLETLDSLEAAPMTLAALLDWEQPIDGRITSPFGHRALDDSFHDAVDIAAPMGSTVVAPATLRIRTIAYQTRAGRYVIADVVNPNGAVEWRLTFAHLSSVAVFEGDVLRRGETIGAIGLSGSASGTHLHFRVEAVEGGERVAVDPLTAIPSLGT